jgi:hypothetical protein
MLFDTNVRKVNSFGGKFDWNRELVAVISEWNREDHETTRTARFLRLRFPGSGE